MLKPVYCWGLVKARRRYLLRRKMCLACLMIFSSSPSPCCRLEISALSYAIGPASRRRLWPNGALAGCGITTELSCCLWNWNGAERQRVTSSESDSHILQGWTASPLSSSGADCAPGRKDGRPVWVSPETLGCSSSLQRSGTERWKAANLQTATRNGEETLTP